MDDLWEAPLTELERSHTERYAAASHAMQSGVATELTRGMEAAAANPKMLRTGVNSALVDSSALARLLIRKGTIGREEYFRVLADAMEEEVRRYEKKLSEERGVKITLG
ncbi:MAG TPA: hypothetical protein VI229_00160 [Burkholderiales bacterium]